MGLPYLNAIVSRPFLRPGIKVFQREYRCARFEALLRLGRHHKRSAGKFLLVVFLDVPQVTDFIRCCIVGEIVVWVAHI